MGDMPHEPPDIRPLRAVEEREDTAPRRLQGAGIHNEPAELVADLLEATGLVPLDRLALVRGTARRGGTSPRRSSRRGWPRARASPACSPPATACRSSTCG